MKLFISTLFIMLLLIFASPVSSYTFSPDPVQVNREFVEKMISKIFSEISRMMKENKIIQQNPEETKRSEFFLSCMEIEEHRNITFERKAKICLKQMNIIFGVFRNE